MPTIETYKKQAKLLVRWHRDGNHSVGGRIRQLPRYSALTDREALALPFPLWEAQEIIALEAGCADWAALRAVADPAPTLGERPEADGAALARAIPVLQVADAEAAAGFYRDRLGFRIDFLHGAPPFYGAVSREGVTLHLKFVHEPVLRAEAAIREGLIMAFVEAPHVHELYDEYLSADVEIVQRLTRQAWGGTDFIVRDPDGNGIAFVG